MEKEKLEQDVLIDSLQATAEKLHLQAATLDAQIAAQRKETEAARATLAEASAEMDSVHAEKNQLLSQWKSALVGNAKRDEALAATQKALEEQQERDADDRGGDEREQEAHQGAGARERLANLLAKTEAESEFLQRTIQQCRDSAGQAGGDGERLTLSLASRGAPGPGEEGVARAGQGAQERRDGRDERQTGFQGPGRAHARRISLQTTVEKGAICAWRDWAMAPREDRGRRAKRR